MPNPFPGMNPYLEHPDRWNEFHHLLISIIAESLNPKLLPKYRIAIEKRIYQIDERSVLVGIPDGTGLRKKPQTNRDNSNVAVAEPPVKPLRVSVPMPDKTREGYLEILELATGEVVTVIEVLSPKNKRYGKGQDVYEKKRQKILASSTNLVEIDLLRVGEPMPVLDCDIEGIYRILISRGDERPIADLYLFNLADAIPSFSLPLRQGDSEPILDLQTLINAVYERAGYDFVIDYDSEPVPRLSESEAAWADSLLWEKGLR